MTASLLTLQGVSFVLPSGRVLFRDIHETFDTRPTGLVGTPSGDVPIVSIYMRRVRLRRC